MNNTIILKSEDQSGRTRIVMDLDLLPPEAAAI